MIDIEIQGSTFDFTEKQIKLYIEKIIKEEIGDEEVILSLLFTDNKTIQEINKKYRDKDKPTNVLSFAYEDDEKLPIRSLGEVIISTEKIEADALESGRTLEREFFYILTHGILHLLGYRHDTDDDTEIMRVKEENYLNLAI